jgi:hypothetical protein
VFDHTPPAVKRLKLNDLRDSARRAGDREVEELLQAVEETFLGLFSESSSRGKTGR